MSIRNRSVLVGIPGAILLILGLFGCTQLTNLVDQPPTASFTATPSSNITVGTQVTLNAQKSSDPQGYTLAYIWSLTGPAGSTATLSATDQQIVTFTPDKSGTYTVGLEVDATSGAKKSNSTSKTLTVTASSSGGTSSPSTYNLTVSAGTGGTVSPTGQLTVTSGVATQISASPSSGYAFSGWSVTTGSATIGSTSSATTTVTLTSGDATVTANFAQVAAGTNYSLTVSAGTGGTVYPSGTQSVAAGTAVQVSATANSGYAFSGWSVTAGAAAIGNAGSPTTTVTLTSGNATVTANFTAVSTGTSYNLTVNAGTGGTVSPSGTQTVSAGAPISIGATASSGYAFSGWSVTSGTASIADPSAPSTTVTLSSGNATVTAYFTAVTTSSYTLTVNASPSGGGTVTPSAATSVTAGSATTITATAASGYYFSGWSVTTGFATIAAPGNANTTVTLSSGDATVTAYFTAYATTSLNLTVNRSPSAGGSVSPSGTTSVTAGSATSISATPASGYSFSKWEVMSGSATIANPTASSTTVTLTTIDATIQADFVTIAPPSNLTAANDPSTMTITLNWTASPSAGATYDVYRYDVNAGTTGQVANSLTSTSYTDSYTSADLGDQYLYSVVAVVSGATSGPSNQALVSLSVLPPTGLTAVASSSAVSIDLSWTASVSPGVSYEVQRYDSSTSQWVTITPTGISGTTYTDNATTLAAGATYQYQVIAVAPNGSTSNSSNQAQATTITTTTGSNGSVGVTVQ